MTPNANEVKLSTEKQTYFSRFKTTYGVVGIFLVLILCFVFLTNLKSIIGDLNLYSTMTSAEISALLSTIIPFETLSNFIIMVLSGISLFYFLKQSKKALLFSFFYFISYPILLSVVEFGYSSDARSVLGILVGGIILFLIFWHFYKSDIKTFFKRA